MSESGTASSRPRPKIAGELRCASAVASLGEGSLSIPNAALSAGVAFCWITGPPSAASGSQFPSGWNEVACTYTSSTNVRDPEGHTDPGHEIERSAPRLDRVDGALYVGIGGLALRVLGEERRCQSEKEDRRNPLHVWPPFMI